MLPALVAAACFGFVRLLAGDGQRMTTTATPTAATAIPASAYASDRPRLNDGRSRASAARASDASGGVNPSSAGTGAGHGEHVDVGGAQLTADRRSGAIVSECSSAGSGASQTSGAGRSTRVASTGGAQAGPVEPAGGDMSRDAGTRSMMPVGGAKPP